MAWQIKFTPEAEKQLSKLGKAEAVRIQKFLRDRIAPDPKSVGGPLKGQLREFWRWRVGDYRILARIENDELIVLVVQIGHRKSVYGGH